MTVRPASSHQGVAPFIPDPRSVEASAELDRWIDTRVVKRPDRFVVSPAYSLFDAYAVGVLRHLPARCAVYRLDAAWARVFGSINQANPFQPEAGWWGAGTVEGGVLYCAPTFALAVCRAAVAHVLGFAMHYPTDADLAALTV